MKRKELEILLQNIPPHPSPRADIEQYSTPAVIAADIIYWAYSMGDVAGCRVVDLGCGTGVFAIGASLMGAEGSIGVDIDPESVKTARQVAEKLGASAVFLVDDISNFSGSYDTCIQNPPFGYQKPGTDLPFIEKALDIADVTYTIHHIDAVEHVRRIARSNGAEVTHAQRYKFTMPYTYRFHTKPTRDVDIAILRIVRTDAAGEKEGLTFRSGHRGEERYAGHDKTNHEMK